MCSSAKAEKPEEAADPIKIFPFTSSRLSVFDSILSSTPPLDLFLSKESQSRNGISERPFLVSLGGGGVFLFVDRFSVFT